MGVNQWLDDLALAGTGPGTISTARRLLNAALNYEVATGQLARNPAGLVRKTTSKAARAAGQKADVVILPSWGEFAALVTDPDLQKDRLLIALLGWTGLRWSEAISLDASALWRDRPLVTISRVLTQRTKKEMNGHRAPWVVEPPKAGLSATVPIPTPLWARLVRLADERMSDPPLPEPAGVLLFRHPNARLDGTNSIGSLDNSNFNDRQWTRARRAAGLDGDQTLPPLDPRRSAIKIKDLRAFAASVLLDTGASMTEAALLLRHSTTATTERHYARAMADKAHDSARRAVEVDKSLPLGDRLDALWGAWVALFPETRWSLGMESVSVPSAKPHLRLLPSTDATVNVGRPR
jgi:integrase